MAATVTTKGRSSIVQALLGSTLTTPKYIAWGTGSGTSAPSDEGLFNEVVADGRTSGTTSQITTSTSGDTFNVTGTLTASTSETITNVGLFTSSSTPYQNTLAAQVTSATQTNIQVTPTGTGSLPSTPFDIQILSEVMTVTNVSGVNWTVTRGVNGSTALSSIPLTTQLSSVSGTMFAKADFSSLTLSSGDSILFNINVQFQ
jgi:hypothetical protein